MKIIKKISLFLTLILATHTYYITARPVHGGGATRGGGKSTVSHTSAAPEHHSMMMGEAVHGKNQKKGGAALGLGAMASQNQNSQDGDSGGSQSSPDSTSQPTTPTPPAQTQQNNQDQPAIPVAPTDVPTSNPNQNQQNSDQSQSLSTDDSSKDQQDNTDKKEEKADEKSVTSKSSEMVDQEEILQKLKTIDAENDKSKLLLTNAAMDQLFNNFVYFKDFIVKNFEKDKMLRLAVEFVNQIYPKETLSSVTVAEEKPIIEKKNNESSNTVQPTYQEPINNQSNSVEIPQEPQQPEMNNEQQDTTEQNLNESEYSGEEATEGGEESES